MNNFQVEQKTILPIKCPNCTKNLTLVQYNAALKFLKDRSWHTCICGFERSVDEFKKGLLII